MVHPIPEREGPSLPEWGRVNKAPPLVGCMGEGGGLGDHHPFPLKEEGSIAWQKAEPPHPSPSQKESHPAFYNYRETTRLLEWMGEGGGLTDHHHSPVKVE